MSKIEEAIKKYVEVPAGISLDKINDISINLELATENQIVFYNNKNTDVSLKNFEKRLEKAKPGLLVLANLPKVKINFPFVVINESLFLDLQKNILEILYPINHKFKLIGITGTNGKTTTAFLLAQILEDEGVPTLFIGTVGVFKNRKKIESVSKTTTPSYIDLWKIIFSTPEVKVYAIEVSSHSLDQNRIHDFLLDGAAFTNISQDHLDYHENMENYFQSKRKIFKSLKANSYCHLHQSETELIQRLSDYPIKIVEDKEIPGIENIFFKVSYNKVNYLLALSLAEELLGREVSPLITSIVPPPGRMEFFKKRKGSNIFIDFAHTPDAVENVLKETRLALKDFKIKVIFGCGGSRDRKKRELMGEIVSALSDSFVITNDNPRAEDPKLIVSDILVGVLKGSLYRIELDRENAIKEEVSSLVENEVLLILGKGHEEEQIFSDRTIFFSDKKIVQETLRALNES